MPGDRCRIVHGRAHTSEGRRRIGAQPGDQELEGRSSRRDALLAERTEELKKLYADCLG